MNRPMLLHWSFVAGLVGGILIVVGTLYMLAMMTMMGGMRMHMMPMMDGGMGDSWLAGMGLWMLVWAAIVGTVVLVGAVQIRSSKTPLGWGIALVVAGVLSFPIMGGFLVGGLAAVAAGVLAITASTPTTSQPPAAA